MYLHKLHLDIITNIVSALEKLNCSNLKLYTDKDNITYASGEINNTEFSMTFGTYKNSKNILVLKLYINFFDSLPNFKIISEEFDYHRVKSEEIIEFIINKVSERMVSILDEI